MNWIHSAVSVCCPPNLRQLTVAAEQNVNPDVAAACTLSLRTLDFPASTPFVPWTAANGGVARFAAETWCDDVSWRLWAALLPPRPPPLPALWRAEARARFSATEPWLFKRAPAVLITLSLGTPAHTDASTRVFERVDRLEEAVARTQLLALMECNRAGWYFAMACSDSCPIPYQPRGLRGRYHGNGAWATPQTLQKAKPLEVDVNPVIMFPLIIAQMETLRCTETAM